MRTINIEFFRLDEVSLGEVLKRSGVCVIWKRQARSKPLYIGKGDIIDGISKHAVRFGSVDGYVGILGPKERKDDDHNSGIVEELLLTAALHTDRWPTHNIHIQDGHCRTGDHASRLHGMGRVGISGCDPFAPPSAPRRLGKNKYIRYEMDNIGLGTIHFGWKITKRLKT